MIYQDLDSKDSVVEDAWDENGRSWRIITIRNFRMRSWGEFCGLLELLDGTTISRSEDKRCWKLGNS